MIFDGSIEHAERAAKRWEERQGQRPIDTGAAPLEAESPERIQKRMERLAKHAAQAVPVQASEAEVAAALKAEVDTVGLERVLGQPDFKNVAFLELGLAISRYVGRVLIRARPNVLGGYGTGFMVSPSLLMTNNHVLTKKDVARLSEVEFDYQYDSQGRLRPSVYFALEPDRFFMTNPDLDFTLVAVADKSKDGQALNPYGWTKLIAEQGKALLGDPLNIIQHPKGQPKQIVFRENELVDVLDSFLHYRGDTEPGSSGSPVFNDQWELIALHHSGVPRRDGTGQLLKRDGQPWQQGRDDPADLDWIANEGVRVSSLVKHIQDARVESHEERLRDDLLGLNPPNPIEAARAGSGGDGGAVGNGRPGVDGGRRDTDPPALGASASSITLTVPLRITLSFGAVDEGGQEPARVVKVDAPQLAAKPSPSPEAAAAIAEFEESANRPYYDAAADAAARNEYWDGIDLGQPPDGLFRALARHIADTHHVQPRYQPAKHVYPWVDLHPDRRLRSIYSNIPFDPRELIEADFAIEQQRAEIAESMRLQPGGMTFEAAFDALEASLPYNCEHVVPQSWFAKKEPMRGDLHHLFACESRCNSFRGNTPYFDFPELQEAVRMECGKSEREGFEPSAGKGPAARATLYFLLRYPGETNATPREYTADRIATLVAWHNRDGPGDYERHRNAAIFEKQGNRNPLIDYPELADRIDFELGLGR